MKIPNAACCKKHFRVAFIPLWYTLMEAFEATHKLLPYSSAVYEVKIVTSFSVRVMW